MYLQLWLRKKAKETIVVQKICFELNREQWKNYTFLISTVCVSKGKFQSN